MEKSRSIIYSQRTSSSISRKDQRLFNLRYAPRKFVRKYKPDLSNLPTPKNLSRYTIGEEIANSITHGLGVLLSIAGLVLLIVAAARSGSGYKLAAGIIFGTSLLLEYLASTLYHAIQPRKAKKVLRVLDHSFIYILIAGSYTPFLLLPLKDHGGIPFMVLVWSIAAIGIIVEAFWRNKPKWVNVVIYVAMGWLVVFKVNTIIQIIPSGAFGLLLAGGLCYTVGTIFYLMKKVKYSHAIWHLFVLAGSVCHYLAVLIYLF